MRHWILKSEPDSFSIDDLAMAKDQTTLWDGVRNFTARNHLVAMQQGDTAYFYHSSCKVPAIVGEARILAKAIVDESAFDSASTNFDAKSKREKPQWYAPRVQFLQKFAIPLDREMLKRAGLQNSQLFTSFRLSVIPLTGAEAKIVAKLAARQDKP